MARLPESAVSDINVISHFLSCSQIPSLHQCLPVDVLVLCASAILPIAENVFSALATQPGVAKTLVLCGGIGHSTQFIYDAVRGSEKYRPLAHKVHGLPEARVLEAILNEYYPIMAKHVESGVLKVIVEDRSTNCGANAIETRRVLELHSVPTPSSFLIVQDPTMSLRTLASFKKIYSDVVPLPGFLGCPTFTPVMSLVRSDVGQNLPTACFNVSDIPESDLWDYQRFFDLIMGEIPRLRDDENGYGPKGKGFIVHVDIPDEVEYAWMRLRDVLDYKR